MAVGRDYADVAPVQGRYRGTAAQKLEVEVSVERVDALRLQRKNTSVTSTNTGSSTAPL